jgi:hypothetical protein
MLSTLTSSRLSSRPRASLRTSSAVAVDPPAAGAALEQSAVRVLVIDQTPGARAEVAAAAAHASVAQVPEVEDTDPVDFAAAGLLVGCVVAAPVILVDLDALAAGDAPAASGSVVGTAGTFAVVDRLVAAAAATAAAGDLGAVESAGGATGDAGAAVLAVAVVRRTLWDVFAPAAPGRGASLALVPPSSFLMAPVALAASLAPDPAPLAQLQAEQRVDGNCWCLGDKWPGVRGPVEDEMRTKRTR